MVQKEFFELDKRSHLIENKKDKAKKHQFKTF